MSFDYIVEEREKAKEKFKVKNSSKFKEYESIEDEYIATAFTLCEAGSDIDYDSDNEKPEALFMTSIGLILVEAV
ncbi:uncharacterized protein RAG0_10782 [Rhynchosporium agropyri]|uniref:Uncharacterized protein n=1 Tax=Rhynchosporium agropyri TaxID=914238 RepID=A0A1E1L1B0_9HELO|nr:uncharacterized protein RAG0_10782 [Rhynchosporium agropyri]